MPSTSTGSQPDEQIRWLPIGAAVASISAVGAAIGLGMPLLSILLESRGHSASMIGLNTAMAGLASIAAAPLAAPLAARLGVVNTMLLALLAGALSFVGFHFVHNFWLWFPLRAVLHASLTLLFILSEFWITSSAPPGRRGVVLGIYATVLSLGFALGPFLFAQIGSAGFLPFGVAVTIVAAAAIPVILARNEGPDIHAGGSGGPFLRYIFIVPAATAAVFVFGAAETGGLALFPVYGQRVGYSEAEAALLLSVLGLGNVLLQLPIGYLSDRIRDRRLLLLACAAIGLAGTLALPFIQGSWWTTAVVLFVWGGCVAGLYTVGLAHLGSRLSGRDLASANAAFVLCYGVGMLAGPQFIGIGMDLAGAEGFAWSLSLFFGGYMLLLAARLGRQA